MTTLLELTEGPLASELSPFILSGDAESILEILNRKDINILHTITSHDIKQYFSLISLRIPIKDSVALSCREVTTALEDFPVFDLRIPEVQAKFVAILDALVAEELIPDFTEVHKNTILYLATKAVSRNEQLATPISLLDIKREIWNDDGSRRI